MLGIKIKGKFINLFDDAALSFDMVHPIGIITDGIDAIKGGYTFPIEIPIDDHNASIIGHVERLDNKTVLMQDEYCEVWCEGLFLFNGKAHVKGAGRTRANLFLVFNEVKELEGVSLAALDFEGVRHLGDNETERTNHAQATAESPLDHDYIFCPVFNPGYRPEFWMAQFPTAQQQWIQNYYSYTDDHYTEFPVTAVTPFIRLDYLLERAFKYIGFTLDNQFQSTDELKLILLYNNYNINFHTAAAISSWDNDIDLRNHVPYRNCIDLIKAVIGTFALGLFPDHFTKKMELIPWRDLIRGPVHSDWTSKAGAEHPYDTDKDFYAAFRYGSDTNDDVSVQLSLIEPPPGLIVGEGDTALEMYDDGDLGIRLAIADNTVYHIKPVDVVYVSQYHNQVKRTGSDKVYTSELIPMWNSHNLEVDSDIDPEQGVQEIMLPHIHHRGFDREFGDCKTTVTSFRLMIYRGMQPALTGITHSYPMASSTAYNINGERVGDYSLLWDREDGVFAQWWKLPYYMLRDKKTVVRRLNLTIRDLTQFRFKHKIRIENQNYFITRMRFTLTHRGLSVIEATMITTL